MTQENEPYKHLRNGWPKKPDISVPEARDIIWSIGNDWGLVREAAVRNRNDRRKQGGLDSVFCACHSGACAPAPANVGYNLLSLPRGAVCRRYQSVRWARLAVTKKTYGSDRPLFAAIMISLWLSSPG